MQKTELKLFNVLHEILIFILFVLPAIFYFAVPPIVKLILLINILLIFLFVIFDVQITYELSFIDYKTIFSIFLVWIYLLLNTYLNSEVIYDSKVELTNYGIYICSFLVFMMIDVDKTVKIFCISSFVVIIIMLLFYIFYGINSIYFFVYNPNIFAGYCLAVFLLHLNIVKNRNLFYKFGKFFRTILIITTFLSFLFILLTKNLSGLFVITTFFLWFLKQQAVKKHLLSQTKFMTNVLFWTFIGTILTAAVVLNPESSIDRLSWFVVGILIWIKKIFFGVGLDNFKFYYPEYSIKFISPTTATSFIHNFFIHFVVQTGIVGMVLLVIFFYNVGKNLSFTTNSFKETELNYIFILPIVGILLQNLVDYNLTIPHNSLLFYIFLSLAQNRRKAYQYKHFIKIRWLWYITILTILVFTTILCFKHTRIEYLMKRKNEQNIIKSVLIDKTFWLGWRTLAMEKYYQNKFYEAKKFLHNTIKYNPREPDSYFLLSVLEYKMSGDKKTMFNYFKKAIKLNPKGVLKYKKMFSL